MKYNVQETIKYSGKQLRTIVTRIVDARKPETANNLPVLPAELEILANNLGKSDFTLVVSGEVNRGKSTFINAIIGQDILPTYDKETTSQVFKIKNSAEEHFYVVLEDGEKFSIQKNELIKYGTELEASEKYRTFKGRRILYIEVNTPITNLPSNVTIVDTPGIGSTFKSHTEIAKSFIHEADAIIYICSSKHPIVKVDIDFIKSSILPNSTSPNVLFVMTKSDLADSEEALASLIARSESQLNENFTDFCNIGKKIIPVDSLALLESQKDTDTAVSKTLRSSSNYDTVNDAVNQLIERQKFFWVVSTFNCAARYYNMVNQFLEKQISDYDLNESSRKERLDSINQRLNRFESEMGENRQREVMAQIIQILTSLRCDLKTELASDQSTLIKKFYDKVDNLPIGISSESINLEAHKMFTEIADDAASIWDKLSGEATSRIQQALNVYHKACLVEIEEEYHIQPEKTEELTIDLSVTMSERVDAMRGKYFTALFGTTVGFFAIGALSTVSSTAAVIASSLATGPVGLVVGGAAIVYGLFYGNKKAKEKAFIKAKGEIKTHLKAILNDIYQKLTKISLMQGKLESMLQSFEKSVQEGALNAMSDIYNKTLSELKAAKTEISNSSNQQNRVKIVNQQTLFKEIAIDLKRLTPDIKALDTALEAEK